MGEPRSSLKGCNKTALKSIPAHLWQCLTTGVRDRLLGSQVWKRLLVVQCRGGGSRGRWVGEQGWRAHCQFSSGDSNLASNTMAHQTETHASLPASRTLSPHLFLFPLLPRRGADVAHSCSGRGGDAKSSPVYPLSHSWWAWHKKKEKWEPCREREG